MSCARASVFLGVLVCLCAVAPMGVAQVVRLPGATWTYAIPEGWEAMDGETLESFNAFARERAPRPQSGFVAGMRMVAAPEIYALIQPVNDARLGRASFESIERAFGATTIDQAESEGRDALGDVLRQVEIGKPTLDRSRLRIVMVIAMTGSDDVELRGVTQSLLWGGGMINVHAYAPASQYDERLPELLKVADSVRIDPGHEFVPIQGGFSWTKMFQAGLFGAVVCGVLGGLAGMLKRKQGGATTLK